MFDSIKKICVPLVLMALGSRGAFGFALLGPINEPQQVETIGYAIVPPATGFGDQGGSSDVGAPKNFGQGYRWNVPNVVYAYDATFSTYFGTYGEAAIDAAFATFNSLSNVSVYSSNLAEVPLSASRVNPTAANLNLVDLKTATMEFTIEQLGLDQPDRWVYALQDRYTGNATCGNYAYLILQRNYDTINASLNNTVYSKYVNGTLFGYSVEELCALTVNPFAPLEADAVEYTTDPAKFYLNVALAEKYAPQGLYFNGLTRDDIMGLRYLYAATNVVREASDPNSLLYSTNFSGPQVIVSQDYGTFLAQALTNSPAFLLALYPNLVILSNYNYFGPLVTSNVNYITITNPQGGYEGEQEIVPSVTYFTNYQNLYRYTFANLVIRNSYLGRAQTTQTITYGPIQGGYEGQYGFKTNNSTSTVPGTNGDFYLVPTNLCGSGYYVLTNYPPIPTVVSVTNTTLTTGTLSNIGPTITISAQTVVSSTNYSIVVDPINCVSNAIELRQGIEKLNFVRQDYDSVIGTAWTPITNIYNLMAVTNSSLVRETLVRVITQPDILIDAANGANEISGPAAVTADNAYVRSTPNFNFTPVNNNNGVFGPGTLGPSVANASPLTLTFNDNGPFYLNNSPFFNAGNYDVSSDVNSSEVFLWASFDGTTNAPVVYPNYISIASLQAQLYFQITSSLLPAASLTTNSSQSTKYSVQLQAQSLGATSFGWSLPTNSPGLPTGLSLSTNGIISGIPTGSPNTYDFLVQAQYGTNTTTKALFLTVGP